MISNVEGTTETGKQLLDRIIEERNAKLLAEWEEKLKGNPKVKKPTPIVASEIDEDEIREFFGEKLGKDSEAVRQIPENWCWCRVGEVGDFNGGYAFKSENYVPKEKGIRVLRISDFDESGINQKNPVYYQFSESLKCYKLSINDIIMCMTGGTVGKSYLVKFLSEEMYVNQRVADIKILTPVNSDYVYSVIQRCYIQKCIQNIRILQMTIYQRN